MKDKRHTQQVIDCEEGTRQASAIAEFNSASELQAASGCALRVTRPSAHMDGLEAPGQADSALGTEGRGTPPRLSTPSADNLETTCPPCRAPPLLDADTPSPAACLGTIPEAAQGCQATSELASPTPPALQGVHSPSAAANCCRTGGGGVMQHASSGQSTVGEGQQKGGGAAADRQQKRSTRPALQSVVSRSWSERPTAAAGGATAPIASSAPFAAGASTPFAAGASTPFAAGANTAAGRSAAHALGRSTDDHRISLHPTTAPPDQLRPYSHAMPAAAGPKPRRLLRRGFGALGSDTSHDGVRKWEQSQPRDGRRGHNTAALRLQDERADALGYQQQGPPHWRDALQRARLPGESLEGCCCPLPIASSSSASVGGLTHLPLLSPVHCKAPTPSGGRPSAGMHPNTTRQLLLRVPCGPLPSTAVDALLLLLACAAVLLLNLARLSVTRPAELVGYQQPGTGPAQGSSGAARAAGAHSEEGGTVEGSGRTEWKEGVRRRQQQLRRQRSSSSASEAGEPGEDSGGLREGEGGAMSGSGFDAVQQGEAQSKGNSDMGNSDGVKQEEAAGEGGSAGQGGLCVAVLPSAHAAFSRGAAADLLWASDGGEEEMKEKEEEDAATSWQRHLRALLPSFLLNGDQAHAAAGEVAGRRPLVVRLMERRARGGRPRGPAEKKAPFGEQLCHKEPPSMGQHAFEAEAVQFGDWSTAAGEGSKGGFEEGRGGMRAVALCGASHAEARQRGGAAMYQVPPVQRGGSFESAFHRVRAWFTGSQVEEQDNREGAKDGRGSGSVQGPRHCSGRQGGEESVLLSATRRRAALRHRVVWELQRVALNSSRDYVVSLLHAMEEMGMERDERMGGHDASHGGTGGGGDQSPLETSVPGSDAEGRTGAVRPDEPRPQLGGPPMERKRWQQFWRTQGKRRQQPRRGSSSLPQSIPVECLPPREGELPGSSFLSAADLLQTVDPAAVLPIGWRVFLLRMRQSLQAVRLLRRCLAMDAAAVLLVEEGLRPLDGWDDGVRRFLQGEPRQGGKGNGRVEGGGRREDGEGRNEGEGRAEGKGIEDGKGSKKDEGTEKGGKEALGYREGVENSEERRGGERGAGRASSGSEEAKGAGGRAAAERLEKEGGGSSGGEWVAGEAEGWSLLSLHAASWEQCGVVKWGTEEQDDREAGSMTEGVAPLPDEAGSGSAVSSRRQQQQRREREAAEGAVGGQQQQQTQQQEQEQGSMAQASVANTEAMEGPSTAGGAVLQQDAAEVQEEVASVQSADADQSKSSEALPRSATARSQFWTVWGGGVTEETGRGLPTCGIALLLNAEVLPPLLFHLEASVLTGGLEQNLRRYLQMGGPPSYQHEPPLFEG